MSLLAMLLFQKNKELAQAFDIVRKPRGMKLLGIIVCLPVICSCCSDPKQTSVGQLSHVVKRPDVIKVRTLFLPIKRT